MSLLPRRAALTLAALASLAVPAVAAAPAAAGAAPKRLLLVTHSLGFIHDSVGEAEKVLKKIGPDHGFTVTCWRYTGADPDKKVSVKAKKDGPAAETTELRKYSEEFRARTGLTVEPENCGRITKDTLRNFDVVLFFTTGNPMTPGELGDFTDWLQSGGAFAGTHCATDTLYADRGVPANKPYGEIIGGYFDGHPWHQKVKLVVEDPKFPGADAFHSGDEITDEIYQFKAPYGREKLHVILSIDNTSIDLNKKGVNRKDKDFAVSWCHEVGKGKVFYTSLGHRKEVWNDPRFQAHLLGGLKWAAGQALGDATPSAALKPTK